MLDQHSITTKNENSLDSAPTGAEIFTGKDGRIASMFGGIHQHGGPSHGKKCENISHIEVPI